MLSNFRFYFSPFIFTREKGLPSVTINLIDTLPKNVGFLFRQARYWLDIVGMENTTGTGHLSIDIMSVI